MKSIPKLIFLFIVIFIGVVVVGVGIQAGIEAVSTMISPPPPGMSPSEIEGRVVAARKRDAAREKAETYAITSALASCEAAARAAAQFPSTVRVSALSLQDAKRQIDTTRGRGVFGGSIIALDYSQKNVFGADLPFGILCHLDSSGRIISHDIGPR